MGVRPMVSFYFYKYASMGEWLAPAPLLLGQHTALVLPFRSIYLQTSTLTSFFFHFKLDVHFGRTYDLVTIFVILLLQFFVFGMYSYLKGTVLCYFVLHLP